MADWLAKPWLETAINCFYDKTKIIPKFARAQIIQFNRLPKDTEHSAEVVISDKWMYCKALFTADAVQKFEKSVLNAVEDLRLRDIKGGLIFLNDYKIVPHVDCSMVKLKKHFQLLEITKLLQGGDGGPERFSKENKSVDVDAVVNGILARHQYAFIPEDQEKLLDDVPGWGNAIAPPDSVPDSSQLSLPSNEQNVTKSSTSQSECNAEELVAQCQELRSFTDSNFPGTSCSGGNYLDASTGQDNIEQPSLSSQSSKTEVPASSFSKNEIQSDENVLKRRKEASEEILEREMVNGGAHLRKIHENPAADSMWTHFRQTLDPDSTQENAVVHDIFDYFEQRSTLAWSTILPGSIVEEEMSVMNNKANTTPSEITLGSPVKQTGVCNVVEELLRTSPNPTSDLPEPGGSPSQREIEAVTKSSCGLTVSICRREEDMTRKNVVEQVLEKVISDCCKEEEGAFLQSIDNIVDDAVCANLRLSQDNKEVGLEHQEALNSSIGSPLKQSVIELTSEDLAFRSMEVNTLSSESQGFRKENIDSSSEAIGEQMNAGTSHVRYSRRAQSSSFSDNSSSTGHKSDESFSILQDVSISDLVPGGFSPKYTSTAKASAVMSPPVGHDNDVIAKDSSTKHVTFEQSSMFEDNVPALSISPHGSRQIRQISKSLQPNEDLDDSIVLCTQEDHETRSIADPLRLRESVLPSASYSNTGSSGQNMDKPQSANSQNIKPTKQRGDDSVEGSCVFSSDEDLVIGSNESPEITSSPVTVAIDSIIHCLEKNCKLNDGDIVLILNSNGSPEVKENSPCTVAKASVMECISQQFRSDNDYSNDTTPKSTSEGTNSSEVTENTCNDLLTKRSRRSVNLSNNIGIPTCTTNGMKRVNPQFSTPKTTKNTKQKSTDTASKSNSFTDKNGLLENREISRHELPKSRQTSLTEFTDSPSGYTSFDLSISDSQLVKQLSSPVSHETSVMQNQNSVVHPQELSAQSSSVSKASKHHVCSPSGSVFENSRDKVPVVSETEVDCLVFNDAQGPDRSSLSVLMNSVDSPVKSDRKSIEKTQRNNELRSSEPQVPKTNEEALDVQEEDKENSPVESHDTDTQKPCSPISTTSFYTNKSDDCDKPQHNEISTRSVTSGSNSQRLEKTAQTRLQTNTGNSAYCGSGMVKPVLSKRYRHKSVVDGSGGLKRKRDEDKRVGMGAKKSSLHPGKSKKPTLDVESFELSCDHVLYSQQDPLILDESMSSDEKSSQDTNADQLSSPVLIPSPPHSTENERDNTFNNMDTSSKPIEDTQEPSKTSSTISTATGKSSSPEHCNLTISLSLPSYQVPRETKHTSSSNEPKDEIVVIKTEEKTPRKIIPVITISDSDNEEDSAGFCWFTSKTWQAR